MTVLDNFLEEITRLIFFKRSKILKFQEASLIPVPALKANTSFVVTTYNNHAKVMQLCLCIGNTAPHFIFICCFCDLFNLTETKSKVE